MKQTRIEKSYNYINREDRNGKKEVVETGETLRKPLRIFQAKSFCRYIVRYIALIGRDGIM